MKKCEQTLLCFYVFRERSANKRCYVAMFSEKEVRTNIAMLLCFPRKKCEQTLLCCYVFRERSANKRCYVAMFSEKEVRTNVAMFAELKLVTDNLLFIYAEVN